MKIESSAITSFRSRGLWREVKSTFILCFAAFAVVAAGCAAGGGASTGVSQSSSSAAQSPEVKKPTSQEAFFKNVKLVLDQGLLLRKDFYTKENMYRYFAGVKVTSGLEKEDGEKHLLWMDMADFDGIFPRLRPSEAPVPVPGAQLGVMLRFELDRETKATLNLGMQRGSLTFEQVKEIFGGTLSLDKTIPHQPPPPRTGPHGNEGWWYTLNTPSGIIYGYFGFDSAGFLSHVFFSNKEIKTW